MSCMTIHFLNIRISRSDMRPNIKWVVEIGDRSVYSANLHGFLSIKNIGVHIVQIQMCLLGNFNWF